MLLIALLSFAILVAVNYGIRADFRYPPLIMASFWLLIMMLVYFSPINLSRISYVTAFVFVGAVAAFTFGGWIALPAERHEDGNAPQNSQTESLTYPHLKRIFLLLSVLLLGVVFHLALQIADASGIGNFFVGLRIELLADDSRGYGSIGNASILGFLTTFLYSIELTNSLRQKLEYYFSILVSFGYAMLITGRTPILLLVVGLLGIAAMHKRINWRKTAFGALCFLLAFAAYAVILNKGGDLASSASENAVSVGESLISYCIGPPAAFDQLLKRDPGLAYGRNSFSSVLNIYYRFSGHREVSPIQEEVSVPFPINVYTALQPLYLDFGVAGVIGGFYILGFAAGHCYSRAVCGDHFYTFCYALLLFPVVYSVFSDQWFAPLVSWIKYIVAAYFYFKIQDGKRPYSGPLHAVPV